MLPIMGRISFNGTISQFSCKCSVQKELWSQHFHGAIGSSEHAEKVNQHLAGIKASILYSHMKLSLLNKCITATMIKNDFLHTANGYKTLMKVVEEDINVFSKRVGIDRSKKTLQKMQIVACHLSKYIYNTYRRKDIILHELDSNFIKNFSQYLIKKEGLSQSTVWVYCTYLKKVIIDNYNNGNMNNNPFNGFKITPIVKNRTYLTEEELYILVNVKISNLSLSFVRDLFIFSCFTGLSFIDTIELTTENIRKLDGELWIYSRRRKTGVPFCVKIISVANHIIMKYLGQSDGPVRKIFPDISYSKTRRALNELAKLCNIDKNLTYHISRHTFATMAISNGMPIETVSKILGHTNITTTQIYAKILTKKISSDLSALEERLNKLY